MEFLQKLLDTTGFPARWQCGPAWYAEPYIGWMHIISDLVIFLAYIAIPCVLTWFLVRRRDLAFPGIIWLFAAFIIACGCVHLIEALLFWEPVYRLSALLKMATALISTVTVLALIRYAPRLLALPGLAEINSRLRDEVDVRKKTARNLQETNRDLQDFTQRVMGRELRVLELKKEVNELLQELGRQKRYGNQ